MDWLIGFDWQKAFTPDVSILETVIRGSIVYLSLIVVLRVVLSRKAGNIAMTDLLVIVLIADATQNAMASQYNSVTNGLVLGATIIGWAWVLDFIGYHVPPFGRLVYPPKKTLVRDGRVVRPALRDELITDEELWTQLRSHDVEDLSQVKAAYLEGNGEITVLKVKGAAS